MHDFSELLPTNGNLEIDQICNNQKESSKKLNKVKCEQFLTR